MKGKPFLFFISPKGAVLNLQGCKCVKEINPILEPRDWTILSSKSGCKCELTHLDYEYTEEFRKILDEPEKYHYWF